MAESRAPRPEQSGPQSVQDALDAGLQHARNAVAEALLAARAIVDAISIATTGAAAQIDPDADGYSELRRGLASLADAIEQLSRRAASGEIDSPVPIAAAILAALDAEIRRWEQRSQIDPEARAVLRAFLGLREILWEFGLRPEHEDSTEPAPDATDADPASAASRRRPERDAAAAGAEPRSRVRRIEVDGG